jgi:hypothetical protein
MLKTIISNSPALLAFIAALQIRLSNPQRQHVLNVVDGLIVGEGNKTLSGLCRMFVRDPDPKAMADTFRESPWTAEMIRSSLKRFLVNTAFKLAQAAGVEHLVFLSIDDSLTIKDKATRHLEAVDWHHDHTESTPRKPVYKNGTVFVLCRLHVGPFNFTVDVRIYMREKTVRRLNRKRPKDKRLKFRSKYSLAREMLAELEPLIPDGYPVYVLFDSWYSSAKLIKWCRRRNWHVICALKSNRCLNGESVRTHNQQLKHQRYKRVTLIAADNRSRTYLVRQVEGRLNDIPFDVRVFISKHSRRDRRPRYFMSTDLSLSAYLVLSRYMKRWPCEVANLYLKTRLGLGDFRMRSFESIEKFFVLSWLALAFLEWRLAISQQPQTKTLADVIRQQRHEHARRTLRAACEMAIQTGDVDSVLERFAPALT